MSTLELRCISKLYHKDGGEVAVLDNISFSASSGEMIAIVGESGSGKTSLLRAIAGIDAVDGGEIVVNGISMREFGLKKFRSHMSAQIGYVSQDYQLLPYANVWDNVLIGRLLMPGGDSGNGVSDEVERVLDSVGLTGKNSYLPSELSGGQQQRVAVARALARNAAIILADEPTGNLDQSNAQHVTDLLREVAHTMHRLVLIVTHDPRIAAQADRVVRIDHGRLQDDE